ncbi:uncharacterized protein LOC108744590 [Agrilus planipennis]|uniref:Uncharacterized protein LOC108744590 n=1 Tax=Agrilus planipennis TaxID=224129 RepID=A0A1W4XT37_AGRPL|nr:uncharacterized protein LOC108744590 [Agrilus planipennis]
MCVCNRTWTVLHVIWSVMYVCCGAAQLVAGIFFVISLPELHLSSNIWAGAWNIIIGIASGMVACFGRLSARRQELLLFMAISILIVNVVNAVLSEWNFYWTDMVQILEDHQYNTLIYFASYATRIAAGVVIGISFLDSQLAFCSIQVAPKQNTSKARRSQEQLSDIEYIIPRQKPPSSTSLKPRNGYNAYAQSWVFDADEAGCSNIIQHDATDPSTYLKPPENGIPNTSIKLQNNLNEMGNGFVKQNGPTLSTDKPVVNVEEASDGSGNNSDRKLNYMKSFSRSTSPAVLSASSSQISLCTSQPASVPIYECLEKLTEPSVYRSRLNTALSNRDESECHYQAPKPVAALRRPETPQGEKVQYASLMKELQKAIVSKKDNNVSSPESASQTNSKSSTDCKNSDAEFSKELEAALQLIQDLESPNTIETTSEPKSSDIRPWRSESDKTLNAIGSSELTSPMTEFQTDLTTSFKPGKSAPCVVVLNSDSQSTSGYSSPTHKANWSTSSSVSEGNNELGKPLSYSIHNTKSTAVISLYSHDTLQSRSKAITLVTISGDNRPLQSPRSGEDDENNNPKSRLADVEYSKSRRPSLGSAHGWNVKSILRKKKHSLPRLCPELEGAIFKSESLAYLTDIELLERHKRNKEIEREIEQRVQQQISAPARINDTLKY